MSYYIIYLMRKLVLVAVILMLGCMKQSATDFEYETVYIGYAVVGGPVQPARHKTEYPTRRPAP